MKADHEQVCRLVKTARGQLDGVLRMVEEDRYCIDVANQLTAAQAAEKIRALVRTMDDGRYFAVVTVENPYV